MTDPVFFMIGMAVKTAMFFVLYSGKPPDVICKRAENVRGFLNERKEEKR